MNQIRNLVFLAGDQLNTKFLEACKFDAKRDHVVMIESLHESQVQRQHRTKIAYFFICMRRFAKSIRELAELTYLELQDKPLSECLKDIATDLNPSKIIVFRPGELAFYERLKNELESFDLVTLENPMFISTIQEFRDWASDKKQLRMEFFYRLMRKKTGLLIDEDDKPLGGKWNFDHDNRKKYKGDPPIPRRPVQTLDEAEINLIEQISKIFPDDFGDINPQIYPLDKKSAETLWSHFLDNHMVFFGPYQDAMKSHEPFLFHSLMSPAINLGIIDPLPLLKDVENLVIEQKISLSSGEGFIRQILGWREYVRGIYWLKMPEYKTLNKLNAKRSIPNFFWNGDSGMHCFDQCITQISKYAYAHHIQRLMITGNFALLAGLDVQEVCDWYLEVFVDAVEWVELPNTLGMALFGDGGFLGSKPYAASANYINKMSDYCKSCKYNNKVKIGTDACPYNYLYWNFLLEHRDLLTSNPRMSMIYRQLDKMDEETVSAIKEQSVKYLDALESKSMA